MLRVRREFSLGQLKGGVFGIVEFEVVSELLEDPDTLVLYMHGYQRRIDTDLEVVYVGSRVVYDVIDHLADAVLEDRACFRLDGILQDRSCEITPDAILGHRDRDFLLVFLELERKPPVTRCTVRVEKIFVDQLAQEPRDVLARHAKTAHGVVNGIGVSA